jgi:hypothetical protein
MEPALDITRSAASTDPDVGLPAVASLRALTRDTRASLARALGHAGRLARRYASGEHLLTVLVSVVYAGRDPRPARAVLHEYGATIEDVAEEIARRAPACSPRHLR